MISLCLQCCPLDLEQAFELVKLICDIEKHQRPDGEFFLVYRKDCPLWVSKEFNKLAGPKFARVIAREARNFDTGWPGGSNMLAASAFIEMTILRREGICQNSGFLLFEPDCVPMSKDWLDRLSDEWERTQQLGKEAFGHWHGGCESVPELHLNGNAVFMTAFYDMHPDMIIGSANQGWDFFYRHKFLPISRDSNLIFQHWNRYGFSLEEFQGIEKNGEHPVFFHGIKTPEGRAFARQLLT